MSDEKWYFIEPPGSWHEQEHNPDYDVDEHVCVECGQPVGYYLWADMDDGYGGIDQLRWNEMHKKVEGGKTTYWCEDHGPEGET